MPPLPLASFFPLSDEKSSFPGNINRKKMLDIAKNASCISDKGFEEILAKHHDFLLNGGAGGNWKVILVDGLVVGIYEGCDVKDGEQANFERMNLCKRAFESSTLAFANLCACYADKVNFHEADLSHSLCTDAYFRGANFRGANLAKTDFSRSDLSYADFRNANIAEADFEHCNLTGADFRNTNFQQARFPGTILNQVKY